MRMITWDIVAGAVLAAAVAVLPAAAALAASQGDEIIEIIEEEIIEEEVIEDGPTLRPGVPSDLPGAGQGQGNSPSQVQPAASGPVQQQTLSRHNQLRAQHCVPPLTWSPRLAAIAQEWANRCEFEHRPGDLGENLAMGSSGSFPPASQVQFWYDEIGNYDFAAGRGRHGQQVEHFTQVVWRGTRELGCAVATCGREDLLVCNYAPAGNLLGAFRQNVPPRCR